jgi:hypothetical protein
VEASLSDERRIEAVFLSYESQGLKPSSGDPERRGSHDAVIATDLMGQQEFSWGYVFCRLDQKANHDWLVVVYNPFTSVPLCARSLDKLLFAHESYP